jgi:Amt family ammonium transporter
VGGVVGTIGAGLLASTLMNPGGPDGALMGNVSTLFTQLKGIGIVAVYSVVVTVVLLKVIDGLIGLRVKDDHEVMGLDLSQHSEAGYDMR